ncbi:hypothetical protein [Streptomyces sp. ITFR-6]|uniref:DUF6197 family protein n=1 Tax=Streptomyces sp. ITFR-6 TaxID=3075197 RepID=UPI00288B0FAF|nr:hypothetical protein [Streptomyces sp. ITFR-6]WNI28840.1 hypothetical protein RLT59_08615 [Streptomyces sp. ITFR-6]
MPTTAPTTALTPDELDVQAARLHDTDAWRQIVTGWDRTAREPVRPVPAEPGTDPSRPDRAHPSRSLPDSSRPDSSLQDSSHPSQADPADWRDLLSVPVDQLIADTLRTLPAAAPRERPLPGRLGAVLPDRLHSWRRIGQPEVRPSTHLAHARQILTEWGWQNTPYRLRNARGARCVCGAMLTAHRLGYGSAATVDRAGAWLITELRSQGWTGLIGPWNRYPGRTAADAVALIDATISRAARAGQ